MRWLADLVYLFVGLLYLPVAVYNAVVLGKNRTGWKQRFGGVPKFEGDKTRIWIHAVSLGEMNATSSLVAALRERLPDADLVFSSTTDTGYARGVALYGVDSVFRYPLDFSFAVLRTLTRVEPSLIVLMEQEVWPNLVRLAIQRRIAVAIANGRLTAKSARRLMMLGPIARAMFRPIAWVGAQDETIAYGFRELGVSPDRIAITSSLKWDTAAIVDTVDGAPELARACGLSGDRPVWVCGSTGPGEEETILDAYEQLSKGPSSPVLVIVPRKPERFGEVKKLIERRGFRCIRRTESSNGTTRPPLSEGDVVLGDTMGELRKFYSISTVAFVGRSLVPMGGSDTMEVAALGKPMIVGPHNENFREPFQAFRDEGVLEVVDSAESLAASVAGWLTDPERARSKGDYARRAVKSRQGATAQTADALVKLLHRQGVGVETHKEPGHAATAGADPAGVQCNSRGLSKAKPPEHDTVKPRP